MKKYFTLLIILGLFSLKGLGQFNNNNLALLVANANTNNTSVSIVEINKNDVGQSAIQTIAVPDAGTNAIRVSGSATSTLYASRSADRTLLCFTGHNTTITSANVTTLQNGKAVVTVNNAGDVTIQTTYNGTGSNQTRGATSLNNLNWYIGDAGGFYTNNATSPSPSGNIRSVKTFGGTVYAFTASGSSPPVGTISAPSGGTFSSLPGLSNGANSRQDFYLIASGANGTAYDVLYILDATSATAGTLYKYSLVGGSWVANGTYTTNFGGFGLCAEKSGSGAALYITTGTGATANNSVRKLTDAADYNTTINITGNIVLYTAVSDKIIKGIDFAPQAVSATPEITVTSTTLSGFSYTVGSGPSIEQSFTVSGTNLTDDISIQAPAHYEISTSSGVSFSATNPITLTPTSGTVNPTVIYVRLKASLDAGAYNSETINLSSTGADPKTVTCSGDVWPQIEWANLQWPTSGNIVQGNNFTVYAQVYKSGVTDAAGQGAGIQAWIGYSTSNTNPNTWTNWVLATYNSDVGNNDEYMADIGSVIPSTGTYYYASRFKLGNADFVYGGTGGFWNGTGNNSGTLTVTAAPQLTWVNLQWPGSGTITIGQQFYVYAQAYKEGLTPGPGAGTGITAWIGYSTDDTDPSTWTNWHVAPYFGESGNNDEYRLDLGSVITSAGTYYYASRFKLGTAPYVYGGFSGGFWDGINNVSGVLTVLTPEPSNHATGFTASQTQPTTTTITLNWTDASPAAEAYLIKGSTTSFAAITAPVDGTAESDGALVKNVLAGVQTHTFTGLSPSTTYYFKIWSYNGSGSNINYKTDGSVPEASATTLSLPSLTEVILPQYIQGLNGTNNNRVPFAYRVTINNLNPNSTYRYFNQIVVATDDATVNGAGNPIFVNTLSNFARTTSPSLSTSGGYGEFTTDGSGSYTGWFVTEPTGNAKFTPGNSVYPRIMLNDGNNGTTVSFRLTTTSSVAVINFGTSNTSSLGTGIYGSSFASDKNFVVLYDNTSGTGRPISATLIESDGTTGGTTYVSFYQNNVEGQSGRWGTIIPNVNENGIRRVEYRKLDDGSMLYYTTNTNGLWNTVNTVNPTGGTTALVLPHAFVDDMSIASGTTINIPADETLTVNGTLTNAGTLTLKSNASGTASLVHNTNNVQATIERYITGSTNLSSGHYHLVSVPLNAGVTAAQFLGSYVYRFDLVGQNWVGLGTSLTTPMPNNQGYMIFYPNASTTYNFVGQLNNGTFTPAIMSGADQFALVPNPYPSAIDWDAASGWTRTNINDAIWIWNPAGPNYASYSGGVGVNGGTRFVPIGQAFFVKSNAPSPVLSMTNSVRVHNSQAFWKSGTGSALLRIKTSGNGRQDEIALRLLSESSAGLDNADVDKLFGADFVPQIYFSVENKDVAINSIPPDALPLSVPVSFKLNTPGSINLNFEGIESFHSDVQLILEDLFTGELVNLREMPVYSFSHNGGSNVQRFVLHLTSITSVPEDASAAARIWIHGRDICVALPDSVHPVTVEVFDALGRSLGVYRRDPAAVIRIATPATGVLLLRTTTGNKVYSSKVFIR